MPQLPEGLRNGFVLSLPQKSLFVGLTPDLRAGFPSFIQLHSPDRLPNGAPSWEDRENPVCFEIEGKLMEPACGPTLFDSGGSRTKFGVDGLPKALRDGKFLREGRVLKAWCKGVFNWRFTAGKREIVVERGSQTGEADYILGLPFFRTHDVMYDLEIGLIGVRTP